MCKAKMLNAWIQKDGSTTTVYPKKYAHGFALLCFVVVIHWLIFPYPSGLLHWHCGNLTIVPVPAKQPWWIWINTSCEFIMNDCITTTKQSTTKPCAYFLGYTVPITLSLHRSHTHSEINGYKGSIDHKSWSSKLEYEWTRIWCRKQVGINYLTHGSLPWEIPI